MPVLLNSSGKRILDATGKVMMGAAGDDPCGCCGCGLEVKPVLSITRVSTTATVTTDGDHRFVPGEAITIAGADQAAYNGSKTVTITGASTFTYSVAGSPATPATGTITATPAGCGNCGSVTDTPDTFLVEASAVTIPNGCVDCTVGIIPRSVRVTGSYSGGTYCVPRAQPCAWHLDVPSYSDVVVEFFPDGVNDCSGSPDCTTDELAVRILLTSGVAASRILLIGVTNACISDHTTQGFARFFQSQLTTPGVCTAGQTSLANALAVNPCPNNTIIGEDGTADATPCCEVDI
jgi:hypothetical protein